jgi:hypothetical protein
MAGARHNGKRQFLVLLCVRSGLLCPSGLILLTGGSHLLEANGLELVCSVGCSIAAVYRSELLW